jgi:hypothetical protein
VSRDSGGQRGLVGFLVFGIKESHCELGVKTVSTFLKSLLQYLA